ncbi:protein of unknown function [Desulfonauticus submarinus]|uniref:Uncharacterized protein n=1 Tax=Desulfonauticus submarinus TaxID=206665 RepID=A0A1G9ZV37_9BACT|nr:DUF4150 domain-containing protein [Desulfonauticus submarinus]SDN25289.1 protein of unknown function [Desulfonauticus submarinus]
MFASTKQGGICQGAPDVCKTPSPSGTVPMAYVNIAMCNQAKGNTCSKKVKICGKVALSKKTVIAQSSGNEPGSGGGIVSSKIKGPAKYATCSQKVKIEGQPAVYFGCSVLQNGDNPNVYGGSQIAPSQTKVMIME